MARYRVALLLFLVGVALAAASSEIITAAPRVFIRHLDNPLALEAIKTCDGGHGVCMASTLASF